MIWESHYWKDPLLKSARWLRSVRFRVSTRESTYVRIEKELFLGFYSIRKLLDTVKISDSTKTFVYNLTWHKNRKHVDLLNWHHLDVCYDLGRSSAEDRDLRFLCNQFIHSFVFIISGEDRIDGFFVASDRIRNRKVYFVSIDQVLHAFRLVGRDYPSHGQWIRNPETGELHGSAWIP